VFFALLKKKQTIELREAYAAILDAEDDESRHDARMRYLMRKRDIEINF
jgi:hypothetical protein